MKKIISFLGTIFILTFFISCTTKEVCKQPIMAELGVMNMSLIKGGEFLMGDYNDSFGDKTPREIYVSTFYMDRFEVSNGLYRAYLEERCDIRKPKYINDPILGADNLPVVDVTYFEAKEFCTHYNKRLPTEAEWEYAARGSLTLKKFPWGDDENTSLMNFRDSKILWSMPIQSFMPNSYMLYDMSGNVREWVEDTYEKDFYQRACTKSPFNLKMTMDIASIYKSDCYLDPVNVAERKYKVNRGGSWEYSEGYPATVSFRFFDKPENSFRDLGFRCAHNFKTEIWVVRKVKEGGEKINEFIQE